MSAIPAAAAIIGMLMRASMSKLADTAGVVGAMVLMTQIV
jgi:hypothetical protein